MNKRITQVIANYGIGDALNLRAFLVTYCKQKNIPRGSIAIYTEKYWWMFEALGFNRLVRSPRKESLTPFRNFGRLDIPKTIEDEELDKCIAKNTQTNYSFETCVPFPEFKLPNIKLPEKFITFNTACGELSNIYAKKDYFCLKSWLIEYWEEFVSKVGVPCVQIGAGVTSKPVKGCCLDLTNKLPIQQSAAVMKKALFHIDIEGGLAILNQHMGKRSVVLFGPTAIQNQGREFNLNLTSNACVPCYEWAGRIGNLTANRNTLLCGQRCMTNLKPDFVLDEINKSGWLKEVPKIEDSYMEVV